MAILRYKTAINIAIRRISLSLIKIHLFISHAMQALKIKIKYETIIISSLILQMLIPSSVFANHNEIQDKKAITVMVVPAQRQSIQQIEQYIGTIKAEHATTLMIKAKGILDVLVNAGTKVNKGVAIAKIENHELEKNYSLSKESEQITKSQYEMAHNLYEKGVTSKNNLEEKRHTWIEAQKKLIEAKIALDQINIYAPFDGITGIYKIREGTQVQEGESLVSFYDPTSLIVAFDLPLNIVDEIPDNTTVFINDRAYTLSHIQRMLDEDTHMSPAFVYIECSRCIIGATVPVNLVVKEKKSVIAIPYNALFLHHAKPHVYVVNQNQASLVPVETGIKDHNFIEIKNGLQEGDLVIVEGKNLVRPHSLINAILRK